MAELSFVIKNSFIISFLVLRIITIDNIFTALKRSCGKVMFLHLSVSHSIHGDVRGYGSGVCVSGSGGVYNPSGHTPPCHTSWPHTSLGHTPRHPSGHTPSPGPTQPPPHYGEQPGGTHPTGMLSCFNFFFFSKLLI